MVYLIHFDHPFRHASHYLGFTDDLNRRIEQHRSGQGARLIEVITEHGIGFQVARTWEGDRKLERQLKKQKKAGSLCPICKALKKERLSPPEIVHSADHDS